MNYEWSVHVPLAEYTEILSNYLGTKTTLNSQFVVCELISSDISIDFIENFDFKSQIFQSKWFV